MTETGFRHWNNTYRSVRARSRHDPVAHPIGPPATPRAGTFSLTRRRRSRHPTRCVRIGGPPRFLRPATASRCRSHAGERVTQSCARSPPFSLVSATRGTADPSTMRSRRRRAGGGPLAWCRPCGNCAAADLRRAVVSVCRGSWGGGDRGRRRDLFRGSTSTSASTSCQSDYRSTSLLALPKLTSPWLSPKIRAGSSRSAVPKAHRCCRMAEVQLVPPLRWIRQGKFAGQPHGASPAGRVLGGSVLARSGVASCPRSSARHALKRLCVSGARHYPAQH